MGDFEIKYPEVCLKFVNGTTGDPAVYGFFPKKGQGILLDLGVVDNLSNKELLKVSHVFISHTHIDHFIGFDRILRVNIPHFRTLNFYGPKGIAQNIHHKLLGYTWNLLDTDQLRFKITEIDSEGRISTWSMTNNDQFTLRQESNDLDSSMVGTLTGNINISATYLNHGNIGSIAYKFCFPSRQKIDAQKLSKDGILCGPWIKELQTLLLKSPKDLADNSIVIQNKTYQAKELVERYFIFHKPLSFGYVTDIGFTKENQVSLRNLLDPATFIICEASFLDKDEKRAAEKMHLTTKQAAQIAIDSNCKKLYTFHYSNIYGSQIEDHISEIELFFPNSK